MRFFKMVLGFKSEHLKLTQDLPNLVQSLKAFLQEENPFLQFLNASHLHAADTLLDKDTCNTTDCHGGQVQPDNGHLKSDWAH